MKKTIQLPTIPLYDPMVQAAHIAVCSKLVRDSYITTESFDTHRVGVSDLTGKGCWRIKNNNNEVVFKSSSYQATALQLVMLETPYNLSKCFENSICENFSVAVDI